MAVEEPMDVSPSLDPPLTVRCGFCVVEGLPATARYCPHCGYPQLGTIEERNAFGTVKAREKFRHRTAEEHVRKARNALFWVAGLNMLPYLIIGGAAVIISGVVISLMFLGLAFWTKYRPYASILTALALYTLLILITAIESESIRPIISGFIVKIMVYSALIYALRSLKRDDAPAPVNAILPIADPGLPACTHEASSSAIGTRYCMDCGTDLVPSKEGAFGWRDTKRFYWALGLIGFYILSSYFVDDWYDYRSLLAFDLGFFLLVLGVAYIFRGALGKALIPKAIKLDRALTYLLGQAVITVIVVYTIPRINELLDVPDLSYVWAYVGSPYPMLFALLSISVMPALTEELAFRGILFGQLERLDGAMSAVIVSGILFATLHISMLSMFWLLPAGLFYGWIRKREGHIWWGVILHMIHNGVVVLLEFAELGDL